jgi:hypothetical protein
MMVSRLTAPTLETAKAIVDSSVAAEQNGLTGKIYLDARGLAATAEDPEDGPFHGQFDQSLRDLAARLKQAGTIEVVLNDEDAVFAEGACPDAALYCGWLGEKGYTDSFTWVPGAVGYHLSKDAANTLRTAGASNWCNAMLENGVAGTLGPAYTSELQAFPMPDLFFSMLLTGEHTLVETYYRTNPFNSWMMVLVGDPLYNPFKANPLLRKDQLPDILDPQKRQAALAAQEGGAIPSTPEPSAAAGGPEIEGTQSAPADPGAKREKEEEFEFTLPGLDE